MFLVGLYRAYEYRSSFPIAGNEKKHISILPIRDWIRIYESSIHWVQIRMRNPSVSILYIVHAVIVHLTQKKCRVYFRPGLKFASSYASNGFFPFPMYAEHYSNYSYSQPSPAPRYKIFWLLNMHVARRGGGT